MSIRCAGHFFFTILVAAAVSANASPLIRHTNEWTFELDPPGTSLGDAANSGFDRATTRFAPGFESTVFTTNLISAGQVLICTGRDETPDRRGAWHSGARLDAELAPAAGPVHYLRYDLEYDLGTQVAKSGMLLGGYFLDDTGEKAAGIAMVRDDGYLEFAAADEGYRITDVNSGPELDLAGRITLVAEVDLQAGTLAIWYTPDPSLPLSHAQPQYSGPVSLTSVRDLRFHATGDLRPDGTEEYVAVDNIRHTVGDLPGGDAWAEIIEPRTDLTLPPTLDVSVFTTESRAMNVGDTNQIHVTVANPVVNGGAHPVTQVSTLLTHDGGPDAFHISSDPQVAEVLIGGESITHIYELTALEPGLFRFEALGTSTEIDSAPVSLNLIVGSLLEILPVTDDDIEEIAGGIYPGFYEPGETLHLTVTTINSGGQMVTHHMNSLIPPDGFDVAPLTGQTYGDMASGQTNATTYEVIIDGQTPLGTHTFQVVNEGHSGTWTNSFDLEVSIRQPGIDWVKADNEDDLNQPSSWVRNFVPDETDRAIMDATVTSPIHTELGENTAWRGIALVSNTVDWTIGELDTLSIGSAGIDLSRAGADLHVQSKLHMSSTQTWHVASNRTLRVTGAVTGMNTEPLRKKGAGALHLDNPGNATFRGGVHVEEGSLWIAGNNVLGRGDLTIGPGVLGTLGAAALTNPVEFSGSVLASNAHALALSGPIRGVGSLTKRGSGSLVLSGDNTYTGGLESFGPIEIHHNQALGKGPAVFHPGSSLRVVPPATSLSTPLMNPIEVTGLVSFETPGHADSSGLIVIDGPISGSGRIEIFGHQFYLRGNNTFEGGILLNHSNWLRVTRNALGTGPLTTARYAQLFALEPMTLANPLELNDGFRMHTANHDVELSGPMRGGGQLQFIDANQGVVTISGDNAARSGVTLLRRPAFRLKGRHALGTGEVWLEPQFSTFEIDVLGDLTGADAMANDWVINRTFAPDQTGEIHPVLLNLSHDLELTGQFRQTAGVAPAPVVKEGAGSLIISGDLNIPGPLTVRSGTLNVTGSAVSGHMKIQSGTTLSGNGTVGFVEFGEGSTLHLPDGPMTFEESPLFNPGSQAILHLGSAGPPAAIVGTGPLPLELAGDLILDFAGITQTNEFEVLRDWIVLIDDGVQVRTRNLRADLRLEDERLFVDGTVRLVAQDPPQPPPVEPGEIAKDSNSEPLNTPLSWVGGVVPGAQDRARLDSRVLAPLTTPLGGDLSWRGISLVTNTVDWTITGTQTLTLGSGGIDMGRAAADLRIDSRLAAGASQQWDVAEGRTLTLTDRVTSAEGTAIVKTGTGRLSLPGGAERRLSGDLVVSNGTLAVSGGFNRLDALRVETGLPPVGTGRILFSEGTTLGTAGTSGGLANPMTIHEGQLRVNPGQTLLLSGSISGEGGMIYDGAGTLRLAGPNFFSGGLVVDSGSVLQFTHFQALGRGMVTLRDGAVLQAWLPAEENLPADRTVNNRFFVEGMTVIENLGDSNQQNIYLSGDISGPGGVRFVFPGGWGKHIELEGHNTFEGDLEIIQPAGGGNVVNIAGSHSLGRGEIVCLSEDSRLGFNRSGGRIQNRINLSAGSLNFFPHAWWNIPDTMVELAGEIYGSGTLSLVNRPGTIRLSADNRNWSGGIAGIGAHNVSEGVKRLIVEHPYSLGTGEVVLGGHTARPNYVEIHVRAPIATSNDLFAAESGPPKKRNDLLKIGEDSVFGRLNGVRIHQGLDKTGRGRMTLTEQGNYPSPFNVRQGSLKLDGAGFPGRTTVFPDAALIADDARTGPIRIRAGGTIEVKAGGLHVEAGGVTLEGNAQMTLRASPAQAAPGHTPLLTGSNTDDLVLSGTLMIDVSDVNLVAGDTVALFGDWNNIVNDGITVLATGLDDFMTLDTSILFSDGRVRVVDGGRTSSQDLLIRVTSGSTGAASVQVRNPENEVRFFRLKPGTEWPSWLYAKPTSPRTRLGSGEQATVTVTADATGLPAGTHRFMLPIVWEHGMSDLILVTVQIEGPSLSVAPSMLPLSVVENTTGEGTVDLVNNGALPVSYRIRRVLAEHGIYTQPAIDAPWVAVSATAQTEITSFPDDRSASREIGFGFPFFGQTKTEVRIGVDGVLLFDNKPAIRVFSNQLDYQPGFSKVAAKAETDRFIVIWRNMVQSGDGAQQTFQAVLHRDGTIDLRYDTILGAWQGALIGLHGPTQWIPAQVPDALAGRTIRFAPDAETARISIGQMTGTVAAKTTKTLTVTGDATGLPDGDSRTATFALDYDGGLTGTAGEVQVAMNVISVPAPDPVADEFSPPAGSLLPSPVVVLDAPRHTGDGHRHLSWRALSDDGSSGYQPYGTEGRYRVQWTTNLASGIWTDRATVTNKLEYTDDRSMDGPVIFYRILKE